ncbi:MAG: peptidoglycan DD-metalloendopeptidase family protein [bacterium]|nr:peptidoglycan DD-metalloendopeptidase family protein [bacterium]
MTGTILPSTAKAGVISDFWASLVRINAKQASTGDVGNVQTMALLRPAMNIDPAPARGGGDITIVDGSALMPEEGPSGTIADIEKPRNATISVYVVREGDTLSGISKLFGVSSNTILWANDIPRSSSLKVGQTLTILPVTGVKYTVKKGDTLASIAKRYGADAGEIASFNGIDGALSIGDEIIIPDGEVSVPAPSTSKPGTTAPVHNVGPTGTSEQNGYYLRPIVGGRKTQGIHGYNGVDLGAPRGTPILASATGDVIVAKEGGWNGGYGSYVVIQHDNGSQTLYSHASSVIVYAGEHVVRGQVIAYVGATGKATGPHVHFEIRNGIRNPF